MTAHRGRRRWIVVGALLLLAAVVRVGTMFYGSLSAEDATVSLMAKHFLSGENFPAFFYRQTYMGSLNGIHLVPALYLFGPSALLVRLNAVVWSLLFPFGLYHLGRRIFDEPSGLVTLALAALPPFLLVYWSTVAEPHLETNVLGVWLLVLALAALTARSEPRRTRVLLVFGLLAGLALWASIKVVVVLVPAFALLVLRGPRLLLGRGGALMVGGVALGTMPAWLFYLVHGDRATGTPGSVSHILRVGIDLSWERLGGFWTEVILRLLGTYYWDPKTPMQWTGVALNCAAYVLAVGFALRQLLACRRGTRTSARAWGLGLLLLTLGASLGAVYLSSMAETLNHEASRYALPAYIPLFVFAGAMVASVSHRSRAGAAGLLAFLLLFPGWTNARFLWPLSPALRARESAHMAALGEVRRALAARPVEALYVDDSMGALVWAFLLDRPTVSALTSDIYLPTALAADGAQRIDILAGVFAKQVEASLRGIGATSRQTDIFGWRLFEDVQIPARAYRMVPRSGWRVEGDSRVPGAIADGDLATAWPQPQSEDPRDAVVVDLGRSYDVARLIFWPAVRTTDVFPLRLSGSADGTRWETLGTVPRMPRQPAFAASGRPVFRPRNGWLELVVSPRRLRYVRVEPDEPVGNAPWGVTEHQIYQTEDSLPPAPLRVGALVEWLVEHEIERLLADPVASARVDRATGSAVSTLVANGVVDNHGAAPPDWLARPLRLGAGDALLVPMEDELGRREGLEATRTRFLAEPRGGQALIRIVGPLPSPAPCLRPTGRAASRASVGAGSAPRTQLEAGLEEEALVSGIRLWHPTAPGPTAAQVTVSRDGRTWKPAEGGRLVPAWGWAGRTLFAAWDPLLEVVLDPTPARYVRVVVNSDAEDLRVLCIRADNGGRAPR